ncbi:MAG: HD domain-containing protein [candidate division NC10 bacterium]|nr:HD domain-containing protein [candidate division NC10 bacterium]MBI2163263.1 HD domain-containing protein [candidate division NC10 bacterium]MBI2457441.1 HD domain-containing protein [candidate division NC10 bacterium]MBI3085861.1 HD domain-containing protein [candidate division NC10 bacterium]
MGKAFVADLIEGEPVTSYFLAKQVEVRQRRSGEPYLTLVLADRTGQVPAVMWEGVEEASQGLAEGDIVKVQGLLGTYQREPQLTLTRLRKAAAEEVALEDYLPRSAQDPAALLTRLRQVVDGIQEPHLRSLLRDLLADEAFAAAFVAAPAAKSIHHAVLGGLLEHTVSVVGVCRLLAEYYPALDRDLLLAAAILHDVGKVRELSWDRVFDYTDAGRLLGHITLGALLVEERIRAIPDFPEPLAQRLLHCILSHHGELEWGSPKRPKTLEALVLHYAEDLDGKVNSFLNFAQSHPDPQHPGWSQFNRSLDRYLYFGGGESGEAPPGQ